MPRDSAEELVRLCMGNTLILRGELEKLCAYADKGGTITTAMVREMTSPLTGNDYIQPGKSCSFPASESRYGGTG